MWFVSMFYEIRAVLKPFAFENVRQVKNRLAKVLGLASCPSGAKHDRRHYGPGRDWQLFGHPLPFKQDKKKKRG